MAGQIPTTKKIECTTEFFMQDSVNSVCVECHAFFETKIPTKIMEECSHCKKLAVKCVTDALILGELDIIDAEEKFE